MKIFKKSVLRIAKFVWKYLYEVGLALWFTVLVPAIATESSKYWIQQQHKTLNRTVLAICAAIFLVALIKTIVKKGER